MRYIKYLFVMLFIAGCSSMMLQPADFSWPVENVIKVDSQGFISEDRHTFSVNVKPLFQEEYADSNAWMGKEVRIIRDKAGYYYITSNGFKNVYSFLPSDGGLKLEDKIAVTDSLPMVSPVFNQKSPNVELVDGSNKYYLTNNGIVRPK